MADLGFHVFTVVTAAGRLFVALQRLRTMKEYNAVIAQEIDHFVKSLNENIEVLKKQKRPNERSWALESLEKDLNATSSYLEKNLEDGSFRKFWDAKEIKKTLERLRQYLIYKFQVKLLVTTLEVTIDADQRMEDFGSRMVQLSSLNTAKTSADSAETRKLLRDLLQPVVAGMRRQDQRIQAFFEMVQENEGQVETSSDVLKFQEDVLSSLRDLTEDNSSPSGPTPEVDDREVYLEPLTAELMIDPVKCNDGKTYDRLTVFKHNLTQQEELVIVVDDVSMRGTLFEKFRKEDVETKFGVQRETYRKEAFDLAKKGHSAEALTMLKNVLQWAPHDKECMEKRDGLEQRILHYRKSGNADVVEDKAQSPRVLAPPVEQRVQEAVQDYSKPAEAAGEVVETAAAVDPMTKCCTAFCCVLGIPFLFIPCCLVGFCQGFCKGCLEVL